MNVIPEHNLRDLLWYKIGGKARFYIEVENKNDVKRAFELLKKEKVNKFFFLGKGSNLIFSNDFFDGAVIHFIPSSEPIKLVKENIIEADAGVLLDDVIQFAFSKKLVGLEWAGGLPGDVGAAVRGNVGAFGGEIEKIVKEAEVFEVIKGKPKFKVLKRYELKFGYRDSIIKKKSREAGSRSAGKVGVLKVRFRLKKANDSEINRARQAYLNNIEYRKIRHPLDFPNCGSVFKNISDPEHIKKIIEVYPDLAERVKRDWYGKVSMGYLIKRLDLSEFRVGNAMISPKHCNFIVNLGEAKATDVLSIIKVIQEKFLETFDFAPEVEVEIIN